MKKLCLILYIMFNFMFNPTVAFADTWKVTAYSASKEECGKTDGITASGKKAMPNHTVACNWLAFGQKINVNGHVYTVEDHGARSLFGSKKNHIKHLDIFFATHSEAVKFGVQQLPVEILK